MSLLSFQTIYESEAHIVGWQPPVIMELDALKMSPSKLQSLLNERKVLLVVGSLTMDMPFTHDRLSSLMRGDVMCDGKQFSCLFVLVC